MTEKEMGYLSKLSQVQLTLANWLKNEFRKPPGSMCCRRPMDEMLDMVMLPFCRGKPM